MSLHTYPGGRRWLDSWPRYICCRSVSDNDEQSGAMMRNVTAQSDQKVLRLK
jgi:hypothetical protein